MDVINKSVFNKTYGKGLITDYNDNIITVDFSGISKRFLFPDSFEKGYLITDEEELSALVKKQISEKPSVKTPEIRIKKSRPILFCNISWMSDYLGETDEDMPRNGGSSVVKNKTCNESLNFLPIILTTETETENEIETEEKLALLGSFETKSTNGVTSNQTHIEKIIGCQSLRHSNQADGVTVVWCATGPSGGTFVVGWYKDATVYRYYKEMPMEDNDGYTWVRWYNILCDYENAVLLPTEERLKEKWSVPRHSQKHPVKFGFGQANVWYAEGEEATEFAEKMAKRIENYYGENMLVQVTDELK